MHGCHFPLAPFNSARIKPTHSHILGTSISYLLAVCELTLQASIEICRSRVGSCSRGCCSPTSFHFEGAYLSETLLRRRMASLIRHVVVSGPAVCLASPTQPSGSSPSDQQAGAAAKVRVGSSSRRLTNDFSNFSGASTSTATKKSQTGSMEENSDMELSARVSRRDSLFLSGALFLSLVGLSSNDAQAREGDKSKEAEQADQVKQDSGKVAERRKQNQQQQQDVSWGKIPQISRKSQEAEQASQVKEDSALVSERRKANSKQSGSPGDVIPAPQQQLLTEEKPVYFYEYPVAQQKSLEAEQADRVKQDSGKVAERRQKKKDQLKPVFFAL